MTECALSHEIYEMNGQVRRIYGADWSMVKGMEQQGIQNLVVAANRLPVRKVTAPNGEETWKTSPGGLVSALAPSISNTERLQWVGWAGDVIDPDDQHAGHIDPFHVDGIELQPVALTEEEKNLHYDGMSNGTLWPLYHDKVGPVAFHRHWYLGYKAVNQRFADAISKIAPPDATVWIHDYQLQLVPAMIKETRPDLRVGFFLHVPFPPEELFMQLPWRRSLAKGILGSDLVGFQTPDGADNFRRLIRAIDLVEDDGNDNVVYEGREVAIGTFPIGIVGERYESVARSDDTTMRTQDLRARLGQPHVVLLGVDRLDYTKGIDVRLRAFKELLAEGRISPSRVSMVQVAEPSRDNVKAYIALRSKVEQLVGEINGDYGRVGFPVVNYIHQTHGLQELISLYRAADVMVVTPFRDGMNLVAKEYVSCRYDNTGVLVLSEFAGAAHDLDGALLVNPHDIDGLKDALVRAIEMASTEAEERMAKMRVTVQENDAVSWANSFMQAIPQGT